MLSYFDLNNRIHREEGSVKALEVLSKGMKLDEKKLISAGQQILMYLCLFAGVLLSKAINQFQKGEGVDLSLNMGALILSAAIALVLVPKVYELLRVYPKASLLLQISLFFQTGVFWNVIIDAAAKLAK